MPCPLADRRDADRMNPGVGVMLIVPIDPKFTPLLDGLARTPTGKPIPLAAGYAPQGRAPMSAIWSAPTASSVSRASNANTVVQPPTVPAPIVMSDFWQTALLSAQKRQTRQPDAPNPISSYLYDVSPSEDLRALLRAARTAPTTSTSASNYIAAQSGAANTWRNYAGGHAPSKSLLELAYGNATIPQAPVGRRGAGRGRIDFQRVNERVDWAGEGVDLLGKVFPELGLPIEGLGEIVNVAAIITSGFGIVDALQRGDRRALIGCSLSAGASVLGLIGALSGDTSLLTAGMIVKWSKTGWTCVVPSEPPAKTPPWPAPSPTATWPVLGSAPPSPVPGWWPMLGSAPPRSVPSPPPSQVPGQTPPWPMLGSTPPSQVPGLTLPWPMVGLEVLGSTPPRSLAGWTPPSQRPTSPWSMPGWPPPQSVAGWTPRSPVPASTTPSPVLGLFFRARGLSYWSCDPVSKAWTYHPPGG